MKENLIKKLIIYASIVTVIFLILTGCSDKLVVSENAENPREDELAPGWVFMEYVQDNLITQEQAVELEKFIADAMPEVQQQREGMNEQEESGRAKEQDFGSSGSPIMMAAEAGIINQDQAAVIEEDFRPEMLEDIQKRAAN